MLGKLIKYEFKATARIFLPMYVILAVMTAVAKLSVTLLHNAAVTNALLITAYALTIAATSVVSFVIAVTRFYKNLIGDEGYLMFTLPVKPHEHITSKLVVSYVWIAASVAAILASILVMFYGITLMGYRVDFTTISHFIKLAVSSLRSSFGPGFWLMTVLVTLQLVISPVSGLLMFYASMALGQLYRKHRVLGAFIAYMGLYIATQFISSIIIASYSAVNFINNQTFVTSNSANPILIISLILSLAYSVAYFIVTKYVFTKRLNLE